MDIPVVEFDDIYGAKLAYVPLAAGFGELPESEKNKIIDVLQRQLPDEPPRRRVVAVWLEGSALKCKGPYLGEYPANVTIDWVRMSAISFVPFLPSR